MTGVLGLVAIAVSSFAVSAILTAYLASDRARLRWLDHPNQRSLHTRPVPRTGGLGILAGMAVGWIAMAWPFAFPTGWSWVLGGVLLVAGVSLLDDWRGVGVVPRLVVQFSAAILLVGAGLAAEHLALPGVEWHWPPWLGAILTVAFVVWMANLYNFMDGMDGLAGGMALIGFAFMSLLGFLAGDALFGLFTLTVALAAAGFLLFNFPPARLFMGDAGSSTLGFVAAVSMLWAAREGLFPLWAGILIFSPFIVDATATLVSRGFAGARVWEAHRSHCYQILAQSGWGHRRTVLAEYLLMCLAGGSAAVAVVSNHAGFQVLNLAVWTAVYGIIWVQVRGIFSR